MDRVFALLAIIGLMILLSCARNKHLGFETAAQLRTDCEAGYPAACNLYGLVWGICNGKIVLAVQPVVFHDVICIGQGFIDAAPPPVGVFPPPTPVGGVS